MFKSGSVFTKSVLAGLLLWAAFPPLNAWPLALVSMAIYVSLIDSPDAWNRRDYFHLWLGACLGWLGLLQGIRLAYWPLYAGWIALSLYLAVYTLGFVGLARVLVRRWRWPLVVAAPLAWCSLELLRGYMITGFSGCLLGHTVVRYPILIQTAAHFGPYVVSGIMVLIATWLYLLYQRLRGNRTIVPLQAIVSLVIVAGAFAYGWWEVRRGAEIARTRQPLFTAALIQENSPTIFDHDPQKIEERSINSWNRYLDATRAAAQATEELDLIVWPESVFSRNEAVFDWNGGRTLPKELIEEDIDFTRLEQTVSIYKNVLAYKTSQLFDAIQRAKKRDKNPSLIVGSDVIRIRDDRYDRYNAALWIAPDGQLADYYAKQHLVMFGEYIPFAAYLPAIYQTIGMQPAKAGERTITFQVGDRARIVPSICFENVLPHIIHRQVQHLDQIGESPDVMVNITNDGWFRGSSITDHHLANATFASVENRRPMLVAANTGISGWIDGNGERIQTAPRLQAAHIIARPIRDGRWGLWQEVGDWPMRFLAGLCLLLWVLPRKMS